MSRSGGNCWQGTNPNGKKLAGKVGHLGANGSSESQPKAETGSFV